VTYSVGHGTYCPCSDCTPQPIAAPARERAIEAAGGVLGALSLLPIARDALAGAVVDAVWAIARDEERARARGTIEELENHIDHLPTHVRRELIGDLLAKVEALRPHSHGDAPEPAAQFAAGYVAALEMVSDMLGEAQP
jgi:hypothetical protein